MTCGIYKLIFTDGSFYIGRSLTIEHRFRSHISQLKQGKHNYKMLSKYREVGEPIKVEILEECVESIQKDREVYWISHFRATEVGLNISPGGDDVFVGEEHGMSKFSNEQILEVIKLVVENPDMSLYKISDITLVSFAMINNIVSLNNHTWVKEKYPELYSKLESIRGAKNSRLTSYTNEDIKKALFFIIENKELNLKEVSNALNINYETIRGLAKGTSFKWLYKEFPKEYTELMSLTGERTGGAKIGYLLSPDRVVHKVQNISNFAKLYNLNNTALGRVLNGKSKVHKGWTLYNGRIS